MADGKDYPNSGILFREKEKRDEKSRDYKGEGDVTCTHCGTRFSLWLSGWIKTGRNNSKFLTLRFKPKDNQSPARPTANADLDDMFS